MSELRLFVVPESERETLAQVAKAHYEVSLRMAQIQYLEPRLTRAAAWQTLEVLKEERGLYAGALALHVPDQRAAIIGPAGGERWLVMREHGNIIHTKPYTEDVWPDEIKDSQPSDYLEAS